MLFNQIFDGNNDGDSISCCELPYPIVVRYIRFRPVSWEDKICMRVGVFGIGNVTGNFFLLLSAISKRFPFSISVKPLSIDF